MFNDKFGADDRAVSPVVGVILMVAITVILAAVIGTFVLDLGSDQSAPPRAGLGFEQGTDGDGDDAVVVTVQDPGNVDELTVRANNLKESSDAGISTDAGTSVAFDSNDGDMVSSDSAAGTLDPVDTGQLTVVGTANGEEAVVATYDYDLS